MRRIEVVVAALLLTACSPGRPKMGGAVDGGQPDLMPCVGLACQQVACDNGGLTTVSGQVNAPNGIDPVYDALVYVPTSVVDFPQTVQCEVCSEPPGGTPVVMTETNVDGKFILENVPAGAQIPIVVQKGRFRRVLTVDINPCMDNPLTNDQARLPKNQQEGDLPKMAVGLGTWDQIECVLRSFGLDDAEFTPPSGNGAVHLYNNASELGSSDQMSDLLLNPTKMAMYNLIFVNCTDDQWSGLNMPTAIADNLYQYVNSGGRLYVTDWSYDYMEQINQFSPYVFFDGGGTATAPQPAGAADFIWDGSPFNAMTADPILTKWLVETGTSKMGELSIQGAYALALNTSTSTMTYPTKTWVHGTVAGHDRPHTVTFDYNMCGKVLWSSYHTQEPGAGGGSGPFPSYCASTPTTMLAQEKILEFLILQISACVGPGVG